MRENSGVRLKRGEDDIFETDFTSKTNSIISFSGKNQKQITIYSKLTLHLKQILPSSYHHFQTEYFNSINNLLQPVL